MVLRPWLEASGSGFGVTGGIDQKKYVYTFKASAGAVPVIQHQQSDRQPQNHEKQQSHDKQQPQSHEQQHPKNGKPQNQVDSHHQNADNIQSQVYEQQRNKDQVQKQTSQNDKNNSEIQSQEEKVDEGNIDEIQEAIENKTSSEENKDLALISINDEAIVFLQNGKCDEPTRKGNEENIILNEHINFEESSNINKNSVMFIADHNGTINNEEPTNSNGDVFMYVQDDHEPIIMETIAQDSDGSETLMYMEDNHEAIKNNTDEAIVQIQQNDAAGFNDENPSHNETEKAVMYIEGVSPFLLEEGVDDQVYIQIPSNFNMEGLDDEDLLNLRSTNGVEPNSSMVVVPSVMDFSQFNKSQSDFLEKLPCVGGEFLEKLPSDGGYFLKKLPSDGGYYSVGSPNSLDSCPSPTEVSSHSSPELPSEFIPSPDPVDFMDTETLDDRFQAFHRIATFNDNEELEDYFFAKKSAPHQLKARKSTKERNNKKLEQLEARTREIDSEALKAKQKNIERCRNYRNNRKRKLQNEETELEQLERKNRELKSRELQMTDRIEKLRVYYLSAITNGRFKCCN